jgi:hypothetical protein
MPHRQQYLPHCMSMTKLMPCQQGMFDIMTAHKAALLPVIPQLVLPIKKALESNNYEVSHQS